MALYPCHLDNFAQMEAVELAGRTEVQMRVGLSILLSILLTALSWNSLGASEVTFQRVEDPNNTAKEKSIERGAITAAIFSGKPPTESEINDISIVLGKYLSHDAERIDVFYNHSTTASKTSTSIYVDGFQYNLDWFENYAEALNYISQEIIIIRGAEPSANHISKYRILHKLKDRFRKKFEDCASPGETCTSGDRETLTWVSIRKEWNNSDLFLSYRFDDRLMLAGCIYAQRKDILYVFGSKWSTPYFESTGVFEVDASTSEKCTTIYMKYQSFRELYSGANESEITDKIWRKIDEGSDLLAEIYRGVIFHKAFDAEYGASSGKFVDGVEECLKVVECRRSPKPWIE